MDYSPRLLCIAAPAMHAFPQQDTYRCQGAAAGAVSSLPSGGWGQDPAVGDEYNILARELLLQLAD